MQKLQIGTFLEEVRERLSLTLVNADGGFSREITQKDLHRPGLALAGFIELFTYDRVQIIGNTEIKYLNSLSEEARRQALLRFFQFEIPCLIVTNSNPLPEQLPRLADARGICIFSSPLSTTELTHLLSDYLDHKFAPAMTVHASLVDVYGTGRSSRAAAASASRKSRSISLSADTGWSPMTW